MSRDAVDWSVMRRGLLAMGVSLLAGVAISGAAAYFRYAKEADFALQEQQFRDIQARLDKAHRAQQIAAQSLPSFVELERSGVVGEEQRLNWAETLRQAGEKLQLQTLQWKVEPQQAFAVDYLQVSGNFELRASEMSLTLRGWHEGDWFTVIDALRREAAGLFQVKECDVQRLNERLQIEAEASNVAAQCTLRWFTVHYEKQAEPPQEAG